MEVSMADVARYLRMDGERPDGPLADRIASLAEEAGKAVRPARTWRRFPIVGAMVGDAPPAQLRIEGSLAKHMNGCHAVYLACGTLGASFDAFHRRASAVSGADALILQAVAAAMIEDWMDAIEDDIRRELAPGEKLVARYSPGYGDFPLAAQRALVALLDAPRKVGVSLTSSLLLAPSKSVTAVIGVRPANGERIKTDA